MSQPKRHHWWPLVQTRYWVNANGNVCVTRADGSNFWVNPQNIGVESELYTRFRGDDSKDVEIEEWFAKVIEPSAKMMLDHLLDAKNILRSPYIGDPKRAQMVVDAGFKVHPYVEYVRLPKRIRSAISSYVAALLVRNPSYLRKLQKFHSNHSNSDKMTKNLVLDNMIYLFEIYSEKIAKSTFIISRKAGEYEYLYADGGLQVNEPWRQMMPFDIHAPLTPDIALQVLPVPIVTDLSRVAIFEATDIGVARQNRIMLAGAQRFVFSRRKPDTEYVTKNFGQPAPKNIAYSFKNGRMETRIVPDHTA